METPVPLKDLTFDYRDEFDRKSIAEKVIKLLDAEMDFCPMAIDGGWGTGKTEFCHKLINLIKEQDARRQKAAQEAAADAARAVENAEASADAVAPADTAAQPAEDGEQTSAQAAALPPERAVIYLDAFASETVDDPLLCILAAIRDEFPDEETRKEIRQRVMSVMKMGWKVLLKALAAHLLKQDGEGIWTELTDAAQDGANDLIDRTVDHLLDQYAHAQQNIEALQETIAKATTQRPILFFIDELDRCRPDFALSILELVKHVFDIPGIKFIFVANLEQLKAAIRKRYDQDVDAGVYLEKFVKMEIGLSSYTNAKKHLHNSIVLFERYAKKYGLVQVEQQYFIRELIRALIIKHNISLRSVQKIIRLIEVYRSLTEHDCFVEECYPGYTLIVVMSVFISVVDKNMYQNIMNNIIEIDAIYKFMKTDDFRLNDIAETVLEMVKIGDRFSVDRNCIDFDEKIEKCRIAWGRFYYGDRGEIDARKKFIDTVSLLNLHG